MMTSRRAEKQKKQVEKIVPRKKEVLTEKFWADLEKKDESFHALVKFNTGLLKQELMWRNIIPKSLSFKFDFTSTKGVKRKLSKWFPEMRELSCGTYEYLFVTSVVACRFDASKVILRHLDDPIRKIEMALVASYILKKFRFERILILDEIRDYYKDFIREKLDLLTDIMASRLETRKGWSGETCKNLAERTRNKSYISSSPYQNTLVSDWSNDLSRWATLWMFFPFVFQWKDFSNKRQKKEKEEEEGKCSQFCLFYSSRRFKFILHFVGYLFFLVFLSYFVLLKEYENWISSQEGIIYAYIAALFTKEIREINFTRKTQSYEKCGKWKSFKKISIKYAISDWNFADYGTVVCGFIAGMIRIGPLSDYYIHSKTFFCLMSVFAYIRFMRFYCVFPRIGRQISMLTRMMHVMIYFLTILIIPICAYGVVAQALLFPYTHEASEINGKLFYYPALQMFTLYDKNYALASDDNCAKNSTSYEDGIQCPRYHFLVIVFLFLYLLIVVVMFFNILIATFTSIFNQKKKYFDDECHFIFYCIAKDLEDKYVPLPFSFFEDIIFFFVDLKKNNEVADSSTTTEKETSALPNIA